MPRSRRLLRLSLRDLATGHPGAAAVFRRCGIAFCGDAGERTLLQALATSTVSLGAMLGALEDLTASVERDAPRDTADLIDFILERHHARHRATLPGLIAQAAALERRRSGGGAGALADLLAALRGRLEAHMNEEERSVFPRMRAGETGDLGATIERLRAGRRDAGAFILDAEQATGGYHAPDGADPEWRRLYEDVEEFSHDLIAHFHLEESALFARFAC